LSRIVFFSFSGATKRVCVCATHVSPKSHTRTTATRTHAPETATWAASG
jgi:hypothetical protein